MFIIKTGDTKSKDYFGESGYKKETEGLYFRMSRTKKAFNKAVHLAGSSWAGSNDLR